MCIGGPIYTGPRPELAANFLKSIAASHEQMSRFGWTPPKKYIMTQRMYESLGRPEYFDTPRGRVYIVPEHKL